MNTEYDYNFEPEIDETGKVDMTLWENIQYWLSLIGAVILLFWGCFKLAH